MSTFLSQVAPRLCSEIVRYREVAPLCAAPPECSSHNISIMYISTLYYDQNIAILGRAAMGGNKNYDNVIPFSLMKINTNNLHNYGLHPVEILGYGSTTIAAKY